MPGTARNLIMILTLLITTSAWAGPAAEGELPGGPPGPPPHQILIDNAADLGIDEATQAEIQSLAEAALPELLTLHEAARAALGTEGEREAISALHDREKALMEDIKALLSDEQWDAALPLLPPPPGSGDRPAPPR